MTWMAFTITLQSPARKMRTCWSGNFRTASNLLAANPTVGRLRPELMEGLRSWNLHRFVIFYFPAEDGIEIVRVLHSAMDIKAKHFGPAPRE